MYPDPEPRSFWELAGRILRFYFVGTYRLAQFCARGNREARLSNLGYFPLLVFGVLWISDAIHFTRMSNQGFVLAGFLWDEFSSPWRSGWWQGCMIFLLDGWVYYFVLCWNVAGWRLEKKAKKLKARKEIMVCSERRDILGLDLVRAEQITISEFEPNCHLQVLGSGTLSRNLLQRVLEVDCKERHSILIFASDQQKNLLEEITYVLRDREDPKEIRSFFFFSLLRPGLSASYSPFLDGGAGFLTDKLKLACDSQEACLLEKLINVLQNQGPPFDVDDLLVLLQDKRSALAVRGLELRDYYWNFESLKKCRGALARKLSTWGKQLKLGERPVTQGYPLNFRNILESGKHLFVEFGWKDLLFMHHFLSHLFYELKNHRPILGNSPDLYLISPEEYQDEYHLEKSLTELGRKAHLRIFSSRLSSLYSDKRDGWSAVLLPNAPESERRGNASIMAEILREKERYRKQLTFKSLFNEDTFEASEVLVKEAGIPACTGIFRKYHEHHVDCRSFYLPEKKPGKMGYEPYQKRFKPEDMLNLRRRMAQIKPDQLRHDPGVLAIIQDLKSKNSDHDPGEDMNESGFV